MEFLPNVGHSWRMLSTKTNSPRDNKQNWSKQWRSVETLRDLMSWVTPSAREERINDANGLKNSRSARQRLHQAQKPAPLLYGLPDLIVNAEVSPRLRTSGCASCSLEGAYNYFQDSQCWMILVLKTCCNYIKNLSVISANLPGSIDTFIWVIILTLKCTW